MMLSSPHESVQLISFDQQPPWPAPAGKFGQVNESGTGGAAGGGELGGGSEGDAGEGGLGGDEGGEGGGLGGGGLGGGEGGELGELGGGRGGEGGELGGWFMPTLKVMVWLRRGESRLNDVPKPFKMAPFQPSPNESYISSVHSVPVS